MSSEVRCLEAAGETGGHVQRPINVFCTPCAFNFNFILKFETLHVSFIKEIISLVVLETNDKFLQFKAKD